MPERRKDSRLKMHSRYWPATFRLWLPCSQAVKQRWSFAKHSELGAALVETKQQLSSELRAIVTHFLRTSGFTHKSSARCGGDAD